MSFTHRHCWLPHNISFLVIIIHYIIVVVVADIITVIIICVHSLSHSMSLSLSHTTEALRFCNMLGCRHCLYTFGEFNLLLHSFSLWYIKISVSCQIYIYTHTHFHFSLSVCHNNLIWYYAIELDSGWFVVFWTRQSTIHVED